MEVGAAKTSAVVLDAVVVAGHQERPSPPRGRRPRRAASAVTEVLVIAVAYVNASVKRRDALPA